MLFDKVEKIERLAKEKANAETSDPLFSLANVSGRFIGILSGIPDIPENRRFLDSVIESLEN